MVISCPSCSNSVEFRNEQSAFAVCAACQSFLARKDARAELIGKEAAMLPDGSLLQVGTQGKFEGRDFSVLGRLQVLLGDPKRPDGLWNEWFISFSDQQTGWIGEAQGRYFVSQLKPLAAAPDVDVLDLGQSRKLGDFEGVVTSFAQASVLAREGELPFAGQVNYTAQLVDFSHPSGRAATLDYSENPPLLFVGKWCLFQDLKFFNLRCPSDEPEITSAVNIKKFNCPGCGAPLQLHAGGISKTVICGYCDAQADLGLDETFNLVREANRAAQQYKPLIPLGQKGRFEGQPGNWTCIGTLGRCVRVEGVDYFWNEFLLYDPLEGFAWLTNSNGHWSFLRQTDIIPCASNGATLGIPRVHIAYYKKRNFLHFQSSKARVTLALGEFYWRVRVDEVSQVVDYVSPPYVLSCDVGRDELQWSAGHYVPARAIWKAFNLPGAPEKAFGVANNQPNPHRHYWRRYAVYVALLAVGFWLLPILQKSGPPLAFAKLYHFNAKAPKQPPPETLKVPGIESYVRMEISSENLQQRSAFITAVLENSDKRQTYRANVQLHQQVARYPDGRTRPGPGGKPEQFGTTSLPVDFGRVPGGTYRLKVEASSEAIPVKFPGDKAPPHFVSQEQPPKPGDIKPPPPVFDVRVQVTARPVVHWGRLFLLLFLGFLPPTFSVLLYSSFENTRWSESDHAP